MNELIDLGAARGKLRRNSFLSGRERNLIEAKGTKQERLKLKALNERDQRRYGNPHGGTMKLSVKDINHPCFIGGLQKLDNCGKYPSAQVAWNVLGVIKGCHAAIKEQRELYQKLCKEYAQLDEQGNIKLDDNQRIVYKDEESAKAHEVKFEEFMAVTVEIDGEPLSLSALDHAGLSPIELDAISCLIDKASV